MKRKLSLSRAKLTIIIAVCIVAAAAVTALMWNYGIAEVKDIPMSFYVENIGAMNVDTDAVYFGSVPRGSSSLRDIHVQSDEDMLVTAVALGNISSVVTISENNFMVGPGTKKTLTLTATAPIDDPYITAYTGTLRLYFRRV
jgi:hypothetical protein